MTIITLPHTTTEGATPPQRMSTEAAGLDLAVTTDVTIPVNGVVMVGTGVAVALPQGTRGQVHGRSSLAVKHGLTLANSVGIIDSDYTGEIMLALRNLGNERVHLEAGTRVAQLIVMQHFNVVPVEVQHLNAVRGASAAQMQRRNSKQATITEGNVQACQETLMTHVWHSECTPPETHI